MTDPHDGDTTASTPAQRQAAQHALGIPDWQRRCPSCGQHGEPLDRALPGRPPDSQACPHCRKPYPGPYLHMTTIYDAKHGEWHYRLKTTVGNSEHGHVWTVTAFELQAAPHPTAYIRHVWDRMESRLLRAVTDWASRTERSTG